MNFNPHDYQDYAIRYIEKHPVAAVLLDMGLGKTIISLTAVYDLLFDSFEVHRVLVVAPLRVARDTWPAEIQKWEHLRGLTYAVAVGTPKERKTALMQRADITIINRENLQWLIDESGFPFDFDMVIIDELSSFKNHNGGMVSAEDAATYDKMEKEVTDLTKDIERLQRQEQIDKMMSAPTSTPLTGKPGVKDEPEDKPGRASAAYKKAFWDNIRHPGNPAIRDVLEEGTDANGGYLVPIEFEHTLVQALNENNIMRTIGCKVITTQNERKIPVANGHTQAAWTAENGAYTESNPTFAQTSIDAFKLTDLIKVSDELLSDSFFDIEGYISEEFGRAFGEAEEDAFINGAVQTGQTAIDRPTGLFIPSTAGGAPSGVTAASATAITADELISLVYSLKAPYRSKAKFLMNDATVAAIRKLKDLNGVYVWQPALTAGEPDRLLGYPLYTSPKVPTMAAGARAIAFGDFSCYWIADRAGRTIKRLNELYATNGQVGFTCTERVDGKLILSEGIKILDMKATSGS